MTKSELNEALAIELKCSIRTASDIVNTILDGMTETLVNGDNIEIRDSVALLSETTMHI